MNLPLPCSSDTLKFHLKDMSNLSLKVIEADQAPDKKAEEMESCKPHS